MTNEAYNLEYFRFIRDEITKRVQIHYKLVLAKITAIGALLAYLLKNHVPFTSSPFFIPAIVAFLLDVVILENLGWIRSAGIYVRDNIETNDSRTINWENDFAERGGTWACFHRRGYMLGIWSIGVILTLSGLVAFVYSWQIYGKTRWIDTPLMFAAFLLAFYTNKLVRVNLAGREPPMTSRKREGSPFDAND